MSRRTWFGPGLPGKRGGRGLFALALAALAAMVLMTGCPNVEDIRKPETPVGNNTGNPGNNPGNPGNNPGNTGNNPGNTGNNTGNPGNNTGGNNPVTVTGVSLNTGTLSLEEGVTATLTVIFDPTDPTDKTVTWSSNNTRVATVTNGTVTAVASGTATITVTTTNGETASCEVTVSVPVPGTVAVTGVTLNLTNLDLTVGGAKGTLTATVEPTDATNQAVTWTSSDENVATVTNGEVTAEGPGQATITVTTANGITATCTVTVFQPVTGITGVPTGGMAKVPLTLSGTVQPDNATNQDIVWTVTNGGTTGATINGNTLTTTGSGTVTVTATIAGGTAPGTPYTRDFDITIAIVSVTGITGVPTAVVAGQTLTLTGTVQPDNATNQAIVWTVTNGGTTGATINGNTLTTIGSGTVTVMATIANGTAVGTPYTQDFVITIPALKMIAVPDGTVATGMTWGSTTNYPINGGLVIPAFSIGETEITWELWDAVKTWATHTDRGAAQYTFANAGAQGGGNGDKTPQHPVTTVSWRDAVVWCNAYSEATGRMPVYNYSGAVLRESEGDGTSAGSGKAEQAVINENANGFRLPTEAQWEYAARGGVPATATNWNYTYAGSNDPDDVAVHDGSKTAPVKSKTNGANSLGLYDMSGNVCEWCWDIYSATYRVYRGGSFFSYPSNCEVAYREGYGHPINRSGSIGFRVVCP